jgi:hypothetical protein
MAENNGTEREETPEEHRAFVDKVAGIVRSKGLEVETRVPVPEIHQARKGEYGCDSCSAEDVPRFYVIRIRPKVDLMLCPGCKDARDRKKGAAPVVAVYEVGAAFCEYRGRDGLCQGKHPCNTSPDTPGCRIFPKTIDVTAIVNKPAEQRKAEVKEFLDGVIGDFEKRAAPLVKHSFKSFNGDAVRALMPRRPILLNKDVSLTFELESVEIAACTLGIVSRACDLVENQPAFTHLTILPPVEGTTRFEVVVDEDGVSIDLPALKQALVEALEAAV